VKAWSPVVITLKFGSILYHYCRVNLKKEEERRRTCWGSEPDNNERGKYIRKNRAEATTHLLRMGSLQRDVARD
jgi:hypothetical protein